MLRQMLAQIVGETCGEDLDTIYRSETNPLKPYSQTCGWLILSAFMLRLVAACPASCVVCTEDVTLCHQLTYIVAAPVTTRVLIITDGYLASIESRNLSLLLNLALLSLGRNDIEDVQEDALHGLSELRMLLLEHNQISSSSLTDHTFSKLHSLQVLALSNNALHTLRGSWFRHTKGLTRLQLDGNQITSLTDSSFGGTHLANLRHLDLSNNFISYIGKDAFLPLPQLQEVDLSRNRLVHMPDVFTPLKQLSLLSLDKNQWSCTCDLYPLARFLRNYIQSSTRTLRNAKDLNCQPSITAVATAKSVLRLSESNCDSKAPNLTLGLKDRSALLPGQDVALLTVLGFAGTVILTCLGLVVFSRKLQQGKANEHTSENLCCRTFDESLCAHEARHYHTEGYCNCHLTQENEIKVMSIVGSRKEMPLSQENTHQAAPASESTALDRSFRNLKRKDYKVDSTFSCLGGKLTWSRCSEPPGNKAALNEASLFTRFCPEGIEKLRHQEPGEGQPQTLPQHVTITDISSDTFSRRYAPSASALARESLEKHLTNEAWQPPIGKEDNGLQPHRQRHFSINSSSKPCELKEKILQKHRSKYDDPCRLLKWSRPMYFQPNNSLICKYVPCDQFQDYEREKRQNHRARSKPVNEQIQINRAIETFLMREENVELSGLSTKIKKTYSPKRVSFHDPDVVEKNRLVMTPKTSAHWKQEKNQSKHHTGVYLKNCTNPQERYKGGKRFSYPYILKKKRTNQYDLKEKNKGRKLKIKLNLHPLRRAKIHPEKSLPEISKKHKQMLLPDTSSTTSEKEAKISLESTADFPQHPQSSNHVQLPPKGLTPKHALRQIGYVKKNTEKTSLFSANDLSMVSQGSVKAACYPASDILDKNPLLPAPVHITTEHRHSHSQFSSEQTVGTEANLLSEVPSGLPCSWKRIESEVLSSYHFKGTTDQVGTEFTEWDKSKNSELNQFSLSPENKIQLLGVHKTDEPTSAQDVPLQNVEQGTRHDQLGHKEKLLMATQKISHQTVEACIKDEGSDAEKELPNAEIYDASLIPQAQSKGNLNPLKTNSTPPQNRMDLSKDNSTFCTQAIWHLTNSSEKSIDSTNALPRDDGVEALQIKIVGKEEEKMPDKIEADSSMLIQTTQMTLKSTTREKQQTWESVLHGLNSVDTTMVAKDLTTNSPETKNRIPCVEADLQLNNNAQDFKYFQNMQPDKDNNAHKEGLVTTGTHQAPSVSPGLKDNSFEAENEVPLTPGKVNEAENCAPRPTLYPSSAEYVNKSPLEAEKSEQTNSNNKHFQP